MVHCRSVTALCGLFMLAAMPASAQNSVADFYKGKTITCFIGYGVGSVPLVKDYVADPDERAALDVVFMSTILARPYLAPPNIPADRRQALRTAFMATMKDPAFLADTQKLQLNIDPTSGEEMEKIVRDAYALPEAIIAKVRKALADSN